ncbi:helix-turn-helix domain-containing protein [Oceanobacillus rekensis]|uniref:helix-turn-helix domain-containing protein n=1 Tax=Oceanobacillus rekensis TaxID=937927 RepID=UPI000B440034|nr:AraC family transcriptional regulator [Oceanobacillus rekensis]
MKPSKIISTAMKIEQITNLNTIVLDQNRNLIYHHETISIPDFMPGSGYKDIFSLYKSMDKNNHLYTYVNEWDLHYYGYSFGVQDESYTIIIGPYFLITPNLYSLSRNYHLSSIQSETLRERSEKIHVLPVEKANSFASVLQQFQTIMLNEATPTIIQAKKINDNDTQKIDNSTEDEELELVKLRYQIEKDFMHAVEQGDKITALTLINSKNMLFSFSERFPNQPIRRLKNLAIVMNTLLRTAARNGNVPAILIHRKSEEYAFEIENASKLAILNPLQDRMIEDYCDLVAANSLRHYSKMTQIVIEHLQSFYDKPIDKDKLAETCNTHPSHLSRKFKQDTNLTITAYQKMLRINKAKHLLRTENLSIEEIAWITGYEDSSYFARIFKKETGSTPLQYREGNML